MCKSGIEKVCQDYNGEGRWTVEAVQARYLEYCRERVHVEGRKQWIYPVMEAVIVRN
jgi:hypothetical protein